MPKPKFSTKKPMLHVALNCHQTNYLLLMWANRAAIKGSDI